MSGPIAYLCCKNARAAIDFYRAAFGAEEVMRYADQDGRIGHAELKIGGGAMMLADEYPEVGFVAPAAEGPRYVQLYLAVSDLDAAFLRARDAGATVVAEPSAEQGGRRCKLRDPFGFEWNLGVEEAAKKG